MFHIIKRHFTLLNGFYEEKEKNQTFFPELLSKILFDLKREIKGSVS